MRLQSANIGFAVLVVAVAMAVPDWAAAAQRYASPSGSGDPNTCLAAAACSVSDAVSSSYTVDGDEVILAAGSYSVASVLGINDAIDVHGPGAPTLTQINTTAGFMGVQLNHPDAVLRNLTVNHSVGNESAVRGISGTMENVVAISTSAHGCTWRNGTIRDSFCVTKANGWAGVFINEGGPFTSNLVLRNVNAIAAGSGGVGLSIYAGSGMAGTIDAKSTIAKGNTYDVGVNTDSSVGSSATIVLDHSNFASTNVGLGVASISSTSVNGNQTAAPVFVNSGIDDYRQASGSPTIDAGALDGTSGATDLDGEARTMGGATDIGADEFFVASPPPPVVVDTTAPQTSIVRRPKRRTSVRRAKFKLRSSESGSTFLCKLDRGIYRTCGSSFAKRVGVGKHVLRVVAIDAAGNIDATPAICRWRVLR